MPDLNGDEEEEGDILAFTQELGKDQKDEALILYDFSPKGTGLLVDDDLSRWLSLFKGRSVHIFIDACHSGGVSRGLAEFWEKPKRVHIRYQAIKEEALNMKNLPSYDKSFIPYNENVVEMSACEADEVAMEENGRGVFTSALEKGLKGDADKNRDGIITFRELYNYLRVIIPEDLRFIQHPRIIPALGDKPQLENVAVVPKPKKSSSPAITYTPPLSKLTSIPTPNPEPERDKTFLKASKLFVYIEKKDKYEYIKDFVSTLSFVQIKKEDDGDVKIGIKEGGEIYLRDKGGFIFFQKKLQKHFEVLKKVLYQRYLQKVLFSLSSRELNKDALYLSVLNEKGKEQDLFREGEKIKFRLKLKPRHDNPTLVVFDLDPLGYVRILLCKSYNNLRGREEIVFPLEEEEIYYEITPPFGEEVIGGILLPQEDEKEIPKFPKIMDPFSKEKLNSMDFIKFIAYEGILNNMPYTLRIIYSLGGNK